MPPDVFLMLASSGIAFVASLMFFVSDDPVPAHLDGSGPLMTYVLPPLRDRLSPPPLPVRSNRRTAAGDAYGYEAALGGTRFRMRLTYEQAAGDWLVDIDCEPLADSPASRLDELALPPTEAPGVVHDLRWHGRAGIARRRHGQWRKPPADA